MDRRKFVSSSLAVSAFSLAGSAKGVGQTQAASATVDYYDLRRYQLTNGLGTKLTENYFADALIPALNRLGIGPVGAFSIYFGPETPAYYLLLTSSKSETLVTADLLLARDPVFVKAGAPFWNAPAASPPYVQIDSSLLKAFDGYPKVTPPASGRTKGRESINCGSTSRRPTRTMCARWRCSTQANLGFSRKPERTGCSTRIH